jgi:diguanylate cyclase (GGDEF)-like protein
MGSVGTRLPTASWRGGRVETTSEARETSATTTGLVLRYVQRRAGDAAVAELLHRSGLRFTAEELADASRWFSYDTRIRLFVAMVEVLDDPDAPFRVGASSTSNGLHHSIVLLVRALGSPHQVFRALPRAVPKFTTTSTMRMLEVGPEHAVIRYELHPGYTPSRLDCRYAQGLFSSVPVLFGLPAARVVHGACQVDGHEACLYRVSWDRRARIPWRRQRRQDHRDRTELAALRAQLDELQSAAADLVASDDLEVALERIIARAAAAVVAPAYLCAVDAPDGGAPLVHSQGLDPARTAELAARLRDGQDLGPFAVVVDVRTARRHHGRLAALYPEGQLAAEADRALLSAYAGHAAVVLDQLAALAASRRGESRAKALLDLAHELAVATDDGVVAATVADALPRIVGSARSSVMRWDPGSGELRAVACSGLTTEQRAILLGQPVRPDETPELAGLLSRREPTILDSVRSSPPMRRLLFAVGVERVAVVPLTAGDTLLGVVTAGWPSGSYPEEGVSAEVVERLRGVADQAASALHNARLLETVRHQSLHDPLTGLPNRTLFLRHLEEMLAPRDRRGGVGVLFCDLDRFKAVNDAFGHAAGDELLRQVAARLRHVLRPEDLVARLSGDEFALVLRTVDRAAVRSLAARVVDCFEQSFRVEGRELRMTTSVGVAVREGPDGDADRLIRRADAAMYEAKQQGRNRVVVADDGLEPRTTASLDDELTDAIRGGQLRLRFQPIVATADPAGAAALPGGVTIAGSEALVRWDHPRLGLLSPAAFLPLAEERGLVADLDLWVLEAACAAFAATVTGTATCAGASPRHVAVNVSVSTILDGRLLPTVRRVLRDHDLVAGQLVLEVVESRSLVDLPGVADRLTELRHMGIRISLDDFGTGYSTLTWLHRLPVDQIKIDRSFVSSLPGGAAAALVRGVIALADELGIEVVAEGVETVEQLDLLHEAGCTRFQGYLFGEPGKHPGATVSGIERPA